MFHKYIPIHFTLCCTYLIWSFFGNIYIVVAEDSVLHTTEQQAIVSTDTEEKPFEIQIEHRALIIIDDEGSDSHNTSGDEYQQQQITNTQSNPEIADDEDKQQKLGEEQGGENPSTTIAKQLTGSIGGDDQTVGTSDYAGGFFGDEDPTREGVHPDSQSERDINEMVDEIVDENEISKNTYVPGDDDEISKTNKIVNEQQEDIVDDNDIHNDIDQSDGAHKTLLTDELIEQLLKQFEQQCKQSAIECYALMEEYALTLYEKDLPPNRGDLQPHERLIDGTVYEDEETSGSSTNTQDGDEYFSVEGHEGDRQRTDDELYDQGIYLIEEEEIGGFIVTTQRSVMPTSIAPQATESNQRFSSSHSKDDNAGGTNDLLGDNNAGSNTERYAQAVFKAGTRIRSQHGRLRSDADLQFFPDIQIDEKVFKKPTLGTALLGSPDDHLIFSEPVLITLPIEAGEDGEQVEIHVLHYGEQKFTIESITMNPDAQCDEHGHASDQDNTTTIEDGFVSFYTCGASTFTVSYVGGANFDNFVDNDTMSKVVTVSTGTTIANVRVVVDFQPIDSEDPTSFGFTNAYANEVFMTLESPNGTTISLLDANTYTDVSYSPRVTVTFDDTAASLPTGLPSTGTFLPAEPLSAFNGENSAGDWIFTLGDTTNLDGVILFGFDIEITDNSNCGNGVLDPGEQCDDGNNTDGDGCSSTCEIEPGFTCTGSPSVCTPSGLIVHYDGSFDSGVFTDISGNNNDGTMINNVDRIGLNGITTMCFGNDDYIEYVGNLVTSYPFTMSLWMKSDFTTGTRMMMSYGRSTATNRLYNLEHSNTLLRARAQNPQARDANATTALNTTDRFMVTAVFDSNNNREIYINGQLEGTNTQNATYDNNTNKRLRLGRSAGSNETGFFRGCVSDVRFYNTSLNAAQIDTLYRSVASISTTTTTESSPALTGFVMSPHDRVALTIDGNTYTGTNNTDGTWSLASGVINPALTIGSYPMTLTVTNPYDQAFSFTGDLLVEAFCGNGVIDPGEQCDDGNNNDGDGCSSTCEIEPGFTCTGSPSVCTPSGLIVHYDGSFDSGVFTDISGNNNDGTMINNVDRIGLNGITTMCFSNDDDYIEYVGNLVTSYPFTMSLWMKSDLTTGTRMMMSYGRSTATNRLYNIEQNNTTLRARAQNTDAEFANAISSLNTSDWFLVTTVFNANDNREIYINGQLEGTNTQNVLYDTDTNKHLTIGRSAGSAPTGFFRGCVSDVRFYNTSLNATQIDTLYRSVASISTTTTTETSPAVHGFINSPHDRVALTIDGNTYTGTNNTDGTWSLASGVINPALTIGSYPMTLTVTNPYDQAFSFTGDLLVEPFCGNGIVQSGQQCDDGNNTDGDGCSSTCEIEPGFTCTGSPSVCTPSGLIVHYDGSFDSGVFTDISGNNNDGTMINNVDRIGLNGITTMCFGNDDYIEYVGNLVTSYPFTMSLWMKSDFTTGTRMMMSYGRSTATNRLYNLEHSNTLLRARAQNPQARDANATTALNTTDWFMVTAVFDSNNNREIYINGQLEGTNTQNATYDTDPDKRLRLGRSAGSNETGFFRGCVSDVRFYNTSLNAAQIDTLYRSVASISTTTTTELSPALHGFLDSPHDRVALTIDGNTYTGTNNTDGTWSLSGGIINPVLTGSSYPMTLTVTNPYDKTFSFTGTLTIEPVCGNGIIQGTQECDDGNTNNGDGCSSTCEIEEGFVCAGLPSLCTACNQDNLITQAIIEDVGTSNTIVNFTSLTSHTFISPPIVLATPQTDNNGNDYPIPVISNVTTGGFSIRSCVDDGLDITCASNPNLEDFAVFIIDRDIASCTDHIETGITTVTTDEINTSFSFSGTFSNAPYVFTTPQTANQGNNIAAHAWVHSINTSGGTFKGCVHQAPGGGQNVDNCTSGQPDEELGWIAIDPVLFALSGMQLGTETIGHSTRTTINFSPSYITPPGVMVTQNSDNGGQDPQYPRARNVDETSAQIRYCEADGPGVCDTHMNEVVRWFSLGTPFTCMLTPEELLTATLISDVGTGTQSISFASFTPTQYANTPIVIATPQTDNNNNDYPIPVISNVTTGGFSISSCVDDGLDITCASNPNLEDFAVFVINTDQIGCFDHADFGIASNIATDGSNSPFSFNRTFTNVPYVFTTPQTANQGNNIAAHAWVNNITTTGGDFVGCVHQAPGGGQNENDCTPGQPSENIGWFAIDPVLFSFTGLELGTESIASSTWTSINFSPTYAETPGVMVTQNSENGPEDPQYPRARNVNQSSAEIRYCEADGPGICDTHNAEDVRWFSLPFSVITNAPPTDILLSGNTIAENNALGDIIGELSTIDPDPGDTHTYSFTCTTPGVDDGFFGLSGNFLIANEVFDYDNPVDDDGDNIYEICIVTDDGNGGTFEKSFTIEVLQVFNNVCITVGDPLVFTTTPVTNQTGGIEITETFSGAFQLQDFSGLDLGWYTTLQIGSFTGVLGNTMPGSIAEIRNTNPIITLSGSVNTNIEFGPLLSSFTTFTSPITYIQRQTGPNNGITGEYSTDPTLRLTIPEYQAIDTYTAIIVYTLYEN